jgi:maleate cis-trans isomerase
MFGARGRIGVVVPANNSVLEPELWSHLPADVALYATRILARGNLTREAVIAMEATVDRAVDELAATVVDAIVYADMVTTFIMEPGWNEAKTAAIAARTGVPCVSAWTALRDALAALGVRRFALGTPYPAAIHALCRPFFAARGLAITGDATLDILKMTDVPKVTPERVAALVDGLDRSGAEAVVLLATDLPTFGSIAALEARTGLPVLSSNQTILWRSLRVVGYDGPIDGLGRLFAMKAPA